MSNHGDAGGKNFIITGGASGLGAAYAEAFLKLGAKNIAILDVAEEVGKTTVARLNKSFSNKVLFVKCDVSDESNIQTAFNEVLDQFKRIDVLINNAGIMNDSPSFYGIACDVNWKGLVSFTYKAINHMSKEDGGAGGTIVNIASTAALTRFKYLPVYCGTKIVVLHFSQSIAMEPFYEKTGVRVLTMCPGLTDTPLLYGLDKRCYNAKHGEQVIELVKTIKLQKVESVIKAFVEMFKTGAPGSIWLSYKDKPLKDITAVIDKIFKELECLHS